MAIGAVIIACAAAIVWGQRKDTEVAAMRTGRDVARSLSHDIERSLQSYDLSLRSVVADLRTPELLHLPIEVRDRVLFDSSARATYLGPIQVVDADGFVAMDSNDRNPLHVSLRSTSLFEFHRLHEDSGLLIGHPFADDAGKFRISLSRRVDLDDGTFGGVVVGTVELAYFEDLFAKIDLGDRSAVSLVLDDSTMLMRVPHGPTDIGRALKGSLPFEKMLAQREGSLAARASIDGVERLFSFTRIGAFPMTMIVGQSTGTIFRSWAWQTAWIASLTAMLLSGCGGLAFILRRELARRSKAEEDLSNLNARLEELALEDGLTRLPNRRAFDLAIASQCLHVKRQRSSLALLMVDIDHFKTFNDRFGHLQGDVCLRAVADEIRQCTSRPTDFVARYGGEEFAILLPATDCNGAVAVAERLRTNLRARALAHPDGLGGRVTVSVGVGVALPDAASASADSLIELADRALYAAKRAGRDRVLVANDASASIPEPDDFTCDEQAEAAA